MIVLLHEVIFLASALKHQLYLIVR